MDVRFIIVADNPVAELPPVLDALRDNARVNVIRNHANLGASESRNRGVAASKAEWILFLDDDVRPDPGLLEAYAAAVARENDRAGFFGVTEYPRASTAFEKGVLASEILTFFGIARWYQEMAWATTSNVLVRGHLMRAHRFSSAFPKAGGGEDIDVFLRLTGQAGGRFRSVPEAIVHHEFWPGNRCNYRRFFRWAFGDSKLHAMHPTHVYKCAPNAVELGAFLVPATALVALVLGQPILIGAPVAGIFVGEWLGETFRILARGAWADGHRGFESALIRTANDLGRFASLVLCEKQWRRICERFDHFCDGQHIAHQKAWALGKCVTTLVCTALLGLWGSGRMFQL